VKKLISTAVLFSLSTPVFAELVPQAENMVQIKKTVTVLDSHLRKKYSAYKIDVINDYPSNLNLDSASIENGVIGETAALKTKTSYANVLWGLPLWLLGMGVAALVISHKNDKAESEAAEYPNQIPNNNLVHGGKMSFTALVPIGQQPELKLHFSDPANVEVSFNKFI
jgi:hypothetical protein